MDGRLPPPPAAGTGASPLAPPAPLASPTIDPGAAHRVFVSYARKDMVFLERIRTHLGRIGCQVWFDNDAVKGSQWWDKILQQIRMADVVVFAASPHSLRSPSCRRERKYAADLGKPILPVVVRQIDEAELSKLTGDERRTNFVWFLEDTAEQAVDLTTAFRERLADRRPLPDPLPIPPPAPLTDLTPLWDRVERPTLDKAEEQLLVLQFEELAAEHDQLDAIVGLANRFLDRDDVMVSSRSRVEELVERLAGSRLDDDLRVTADNWSTRTPAELRHGDPELDNRLAPLLRRIRRKEFVPVLGWGMTDSLMGPMRFLMSDWNDRVGWPGGRRARDLPAAAQYIKVKRGRGELVNALAEGLGRQLGRWTGRDIDVADLDPARFDRLLAETWRDWPGEAANDPYRVLAELSCPVYIVAHPWSLMEEALVAAGREPVVEVCWWRPDVVPDHTGATPAPAGWPDPSPLLVTPDDEKPYVPSIDRPLVYHVFGRIEYPNSMVLTEEDHLDFLINVSKLQLVPPSVRSHLAQTAVLMLGFELEETAARVLMRSIIHQEGQTHSLDDRDPPQNVGTQDLSVLDSPDPQYINYVADSLERSNPKLGVVWGRADEFTRLLHELVEQANE